MADYIDKVVNATVDLLSGNVDESGGGGNFTGIVTNDTGTIGLLGTGTSNDPLKGSVNVSSREGNQLQTVAMGTEKGLFVPASDVKVSVKPYNAIKVETTPGQEGIYVSPSSSNLLSPDSSLTITADVVDPLKANIEVNIVPTSEYTALRITEDGLQVNISKAVDNALEIKNGDLYAPPAEKGDTGPMGPQGPAGVGVKVLGNLENIADLPDPAEYNVGDTWVIDGHFWTKITTGWEDIGNFMGPDGKSAYQIAVEDGFVGTEEDWLLSLKGRDGIGLRILGSFANIIDLPTIGNENGDAYIVQSVMYVWDGTKWSAVGQVGPEGKSAYQVAVVNGFVGSQSAWLLSLVGPQGPVGARGPQGIKGDNANTLNVKGTKATIGDLPSAGNTSGDTWFVGRNAYVWNGTSWDDIGEIQGPQGLPGAEGAQGIQGPQGPRGLNGQDNYEIALANGFVGSESEWLASLRGPQGIQGPQGPVGPIGPEGPVGAGINVKGTLTDPSELPLTGNAGDAYVIAGNLWSWTGSAFENMGPFRGEKGETGSQGPQGIQGPIGPEGPEGPQGIQGGTGPQGETGPEGPRGQALSAKGTKPTVGELPISENVDGDLWTVDGIGYVWDTDTWINIGSVQGPRGPAGANGIDGVDGATGPQGATGEQGPQGPEGPEGPQGPQGEMGAGVKILGRKASEGDLPPTGTTGEGWLIGLDFWVWDGAAYTNAGPIQGPKGDVGPRGVIGPTGLQGAKGDTGAKGDPGNRWIVMPRPPEAIDGQPGDYFLDSTTLSVYLKIGPTTWSESIGKLGGGNVYDGPHDGALKGRLDGDWVNIPVLEAPEDSGVYYRKNGAWVKFDRYDVKLTRNVDALNLATSQSFSFDATAAHVFTFTNLPASDRTMPFVVTLTGSGGNIQWPATLKWSQNQAPVLGASYTHLIFFWDGTNVTGSVAMSV